MTVRRCETAIAEEIQSERKDAKSQRETTDGWGKNWSLSPINITSHFTMFGPC